MTTKNKKDELFYQLICDLSQDIINDTQLAADKTIGLSCQFLGEESRGLADDFRALCVNSDSLHANAPIGENVALNLDPSNTGNQSEIDTSYAEQLHIVQQNMEQLVHKDATIREEVNVILSAMQFSEFLRQHLAGLRHSFNVMINAEGQNTDQLKLAMQEKMHAFDERKAFHQHVMHENMPPEDQKITQDLIDQLIG